MASIVPIDEGENRLSLGETDDHLGTASGNEFDNTEDFYEDMVGISRLDELVGRLWFAKLYRKVREVFTYDYIKQFTRWFLESATCTINITVSRSYFFRNCQFKR